MGMSLMIYWGYGCKNRIREIRNGSNYFEKNTNKQTNSSSKQTDLLVERVYHSADVFDRLNALLVSLVLLWRVEQNQPSRSLIQNAVKLFIEDHLAEFAFDERQRQSDLVGDVLNLHARERLDDAHEILLKERVIQLAEVLLQERVLDDVLLRCSSLEGAKRAFLAGVCNATERLECRTCILESELTLEDACNFFRLNNKGRDEI